MYLHFTYSRSLNKMVQSKSNFYIWISRFLLGRFWEQYRPLFYLSSSDVKSPWGGGEAAQCLDSGSAAGECMIIAGPFFHSPSLFTSLSSHHFVGHFWYARALVYARARCRQHWQQAPHLSAQLRRIWQSSYLYITCHNVWRDVRFTL